MAAFGEKSAIYFIIIIVVGNMFMLNMFVSILLEVRCVGCHGQALLRADGGQRVSQAFDRDRQGAFGVPAVEEIHDDAHQVELQNRGIEKLLRQCGGQLRRLGCMGDGGNSVVLEDSAMRATVAPCPAGAVPREVAPLDHPDGASKSIPVVQAASGVVGDSIPEAAPPSAPPTGDANDSEAPSSSPSDTTVNPSVVKPSSPVPVEAPSPPGTAVERAVTAPSSSPTSSPPSPGFAAERRISVTRNPNAAAITYTTCSKASVLSVRAIVPKASAIDGDTEPHGELAIDIKSSGAVYAVSGQRPAVISEENALIDELRVALTTAGLSSPMRAIYRLRIAILRVVKTRVFESVIMAFIIWSCINLALDSVGLHVRRDAGAARMVRLCQCGSCGPTFLLL